MNRIQRASLIMSLVECLREGGSWCGETHIQKAAYFLQELLKVPTGYNFILYKHGPFSFELRDELTALRADGLLALELKSWPYGPSFAATAAGASLNKQLQKAMSRYEGAVSFVANQIGPEHVTELEKLATALFVIRHQHGKGSVELRAKKINELKPHIAIEEAKLALMKLDTIVRNSRSLVEAGAA
jgi:hypothetical protein